MEKRRGFGFLSGNALKLIALVSMTLDHVGLELFPDLEIFRILGRLALPIFAYMIAEGCTYTKNKWKYVGLTFGVGLLCQIVYFVAMESLYMCILITFTLSILLIYALMWLEKRRDLLSVLVFVLVLAAELYVVEILPRTLLSGTDFAIDYGQYGVILPVLVYMGKKKHTKLLFLTPGLLGLALTSPFEVQWYAFLALIPLAFYNGSRGKWRLKYLFYVYYPLHLGIIYLISLII